MPAAQSGGTQFAEAIDYLKGKLPESSVAWNDLAGPVHAKVFTVAGATSADLAKDIQGSLVSALENGSTITQFRKDFDAIVQKHGWTYNGKRGWRTSVIFNTNMRAATMAGRWKQIIANQHRRPFLQYRTAGDARVRPQHRQWDGIIRAVADSFWSTHYPPCGWGCRCTVRAYSQGEIEDDNLHVETQPFKEQWRNVIGDDGVEDRVPVGIDPGWDHNVGKSWLDPELALGRKLATLPKALRGPLVDKTISPAFQKAMNGNWKRFQSTIEDAGRPAGNAQIVGFFDSAVLDKIATELPAVELKSSAMVALDTNINTLKGAAWPADWVDELPERLRNYQAVLWNESTGSLVVVPQGHFDAGAQPTVVVKLNRKTRYGTAAQVESLGADAPADLTGPQYRLLLGRLPGPNKTGN